MSSSVAKKRKRLNLPIIWIAAGAVVVIIAVILFSSLATPVKSCMQLPFGTYHTYCYTGSGFMYIDGMELKYFDIKSSKNNYSVPLSSTDVSLSGGSGIQVIYTSTYIKIIGSQFPIEFSGEILGVECYDKYVAVHKRENGADSIRLFAASGAQLNEITFSGKSLMDFGFFYRQKNIGLYSVSLDVSSSSPISTITTYSVASGATTGIMTVQNQLVQAIEFSEKSNYVIGTENIICFSADSNYENYRLLSYGYQLDDISFAKDTAMFIMNQNTAASTVSKRVYLANQASVPNDSSLSFTPAANTRLCFTAKSKLFTLTPTQLITFSSSGKQKKQYDLPYNTETAEKLSDTRLLLSSGGKLYLLNIKP